MTREERRRFAELFDVFLKTKFFLVDRLIPRDATDEDRDAIFLLADVRAFEAVEAVATPREWELFKSEVAREKRRRARQIGNGRAPSVARSEGPQWPDEGELWTLVSHRPREGSKSRSWTVRGPNEQD